VTNDVWRQLDPNSGRLTRRSAWLVAAAFLVGLALLAGIGVAERAGLLEAQLAWSTSASWQTTAVDHVIVHSVNVENTGWIPVTVTGAGRDGPGLRLQRVDGAFPTTVPAGGTFTFTLTYEVIDCAAVRADTWPVPVRVQRWWGTQSVFIDLPDAPADNGMVMPWQRALADQAC
jgi:hypothetical protein